MKMKLLTKLRTWGLLLPLILSFSSCEWQLWGGDDAPDAGYYQIPIESLDGWHKGVCYFDGSSTSCDYYIVSCTDSIDGSITVCLSAGGNSDAGKAMTFHLSSSADVLKVTAPGFRFNGLSDDEKVDFTVYDVGDNIAGHFSIPYLLQDEAFPSRTSYPKVMDFDRFTDEALRFIGDSIQAVCGLGGEILRNAVSDYLSGGLIGVAAMAFSGEVLSAKSVKGLLQMSYERDMTRFLGRADIKIVSVTQTTDTTVIVEGYISNASSIPSKRQAIHEGVAVDVENKVLFGVAVGRTFPPGFQSNEACTKLKTVSEEYFSFTVNLETKPGKNYYFRPFLISENNILEEKVLLPDCYLGIRYGESEKFMNMNLIVELSKYKQVKSERSESGTGYEVQFTIEGKVPYLYDEIKNWGFVARTKTDSYAMLYYAKEMEWYDIPNEKKFKCKIGLSAADIMERGVDRISDFIITPVVEFKDTIINLESKEYTIIVEGGSCPDTNHPHAIDLGLSVKWSCKNVGGSNPWDFEGFYAWGETGTKGAHIVSNYQYVRDLDGDGNYYDDDSNWIDIGTNISGTSYDVAHVKWGEGWRMPTIEDAEELYNECTWEWIEPSRSFKVIGPNGRNISLGGSYWIGTLSKEEGESCYGYYLYTTSSRIYSISWDYRHRGLRVRPVKE